MTGVAQKVSQGHPVAAGAWVPVSPAWRGCEGKPGLQDKALLMCDRGLAPAATSLLAAGSALALRPQTLGCGGTEDDALVTSQSKGCEAKAL